MTLTLTSENGTRPCILCEKWQSVYVFMDSEATEEQQRNTDGICQACINNADGPGKFESYNHNHEDIATALMLRQWSLISMEDDYMHNGEDYCARFDNYLLIEDGRGFVTFEKFDSATKAEEMYDRYFNSGWGAQEDDIYVNYDTPRGVEIYDAGSRKPVPIHPNANNHISENRIDAAINLYMASNGYFPNVWNDIGRGNIQLRKMKVVSWL